MLRAYTLVNYPYPLLGKTLTGPTQQLCSNGMT
jgi:hypothetical protein